MMHRDGMYAIIGVAIIVVGTAWWPSTYWTSESNQIEYSEIDVTIEIQDLYRSYWLNSSPELSGTFLVIKFTEPGTYKLSYGAEFEDTATITEAPAYRQLSTESRPELIDNSGVRFTIENQGREIIETHTLNWEYGG
jgi:hypothetical protein